MINWEVRCKNKLFWLTLIPAVLLLFQTIFKTVGIVWDIGELENNLIEIINAVFSVMAILGIVVDPTTAGVRDSNRAMFYTEPHKDGD